MASKCPYKAYLTKRAGTSCIQDNMFWNNFRSNLFSLSRVSSAIWDKSEREIFKD